MKIKDLTTPIFEAPIDDYAPIGNWGDKEKLNSFSDPKERKAIQNPKLMDKARQKFGNTEVMMNFYFVNLPGAAKFAEHGYASPDYLAKNMPKAWKLINQRREQQGTDWSESLNVIFVSNSGVNKVRMTPWIMAHRIGHTIQSSTFMRGDSDRVDNKLSQVKYFWKQIVNDIERTTLDIFEEVYGLNSNRWGRGGYGSNTKDFWSDTFVAKFFESIGTMNSARQGNLGGRPYEFVYELFAQQVTMGKISFNQLPQSFGLRNNKAYMRGDVEEDREYGDMMLNRGLAWMLPDYYDSVMHSLTGEFLIM